MVSCCSSLISGFAKLEKQLSLDVGRFNTQEEKSTATQSNVVSLGSKVFGIVLLYHGGKECWNALPSNFTRLFKGVFWCGVGHDFVVIGDNHFQLYCIEPVEKVALNYLKSYARKHVQGNVDRIEEEGGLFAGFLAKGVFELAILKEMPQNPEEKRELVNCVKERIFRQNTFFYRVMDLVAKCILDSDGYDWFRNRLN